MGNSSSLDVDPATVKPGENLLNSPTSGSDDDLPYIYPRQRLSRINRVDNVLNNTVVENFTESVSSDVVKQAEHDFTMERMLLKKNRNIPIGRSSSPTRVKCFHCAHGHGQQCCLYIGDHIEDVKLYAKWKQHLERDVIRPGHFPRVPEAVSGGSTPSWFPKGTYNRRRDIRRHMCESTRTPMVYLRRYSLPLLLSSKENKMLEKKVKKLTPHEEYMQELARKKKLALLYRPVMIDFNCKSEQAVEALEGEIEGIRS